jgi:hypothetical protein
MFQGRFKAVLVDGMPICSKVCRDVELNPARAQGERAGGVAVAKLPRPRGRGLSSQ